MSSGTVLILTLIIGLGIFIAGISMRINDRKKQKLEIKNDWLFFESAVRRRDVQEIIRLGIKLCDNPVLNGEQAKSIISFVNQNINKYPELEELRLAHLNRSSIRFTGIGRIVDTLIPDENENES